MPEFQPENLQNAWDILADYIKYTRRNSEILRDTYPESVVTWGLIQQLYDAYKAMTVQSDLKKQIAAILSRAEMPYLLDGIYNDDFEKIYLKDLLLYISGELHISSSGSSSEEIGESSGTYALSLLLHQLYELSGHNRP